MRVLDELEREVERLAAQAGTVRPRRRRWRAGVLLGVLGVVGVAGVAVGQPVLRQVLPVDPGAPVAPPPGPGNRGADHQSSPDALREHLARSDREYLKGVDWDAARSFAIPGTRLRGWTFSQPGKRCLALPDPLAEGYGVVCRTPKQIADGQATIVFLPPIAANAPNIVGVLVEPGQTASIDAPPGTTPNWERFGGAYAGTAPAGSRLVAGGRRQAIDPPSSPYIPPAPAGG